MKVGGVLLAFGLWLCSGGCSSDSCFSPLDADDPEGNVFRPGWGIPFDDLLMDYLDIQPVRVRVGVQRFQPPRELVLGPRSVTDYDTMTMELVRVLRGMRIFESVDIATPERTGDFDVLLIPEVVQARSKRRDTFLRTYLCTDLELRAFVIPLAGGGGFWVDAQPRKKMYTRKYQAGNTDRGRMYEELAKQVYGAFVELGAGTAMSEQMTRIAQARSQRPAGETREPAISIDEAMRQFAAERKSRSPDVAGS